MADNTINVKIREAYDTEANWTQKNPKLLQGQIAISSDKHGMYKVGDGTKTWSQLSYASHPASDVYAWAKAQTKPSYSASEITGSVTGVKGSSETSYRTGDVNITKAHIGLSNVDNKSSVTIRSEITSSNVTSALGYTPVNKAGDTMSDCLTIQKDSGDTYGVFTRTDTDTTLCVGVGTGGVNHGIYSSKLNKWIAYADASNIYLNGNALTATTADDAIRARLFTSRQTTPNLTASGKTGIQHFLATSSMAPSGGTDVRPGNKDGHIIHMSWDNTGGYDSQIYMQNGNTPKLLMRGQQGGTWGGWTKIYTANDKPSKSDVGLGNVDNKSSATIRGEITSQNVTTALGYTPVNKAGDTMTGSLTATSFQTGDNDNNFFQTRRLRGEGNASTYYHAIDFGYAHHDQVDFYEYGGVFNFHKHTGQAIDVGDTIIGTINSDGWNGGAVLTGAPTAPTATAGTNTTQIATTEFVKTAVDNFAASGVINKATTLETPRTIDGVAFNGSANVTHFGVCSTNAETAEKAVACNNFSLDTGQVITVKFTTTNTAQTDITLNVNSTGAKAVKYRNSVAPSSSLFVAGRTYQFVYDGEAYQLVGDIDSNMDSKVMQSLSTEDVDHPVLFSYTNKNDTTADINNGSYRSNSIYANPQTGTLTATTLKGYLDGNAKSATASSFLNPTDSNTTYGSSTERGTITDGVVVFGESFRNTVDFVNEDESMISDSGDITMWMKQEADNDVRLNMSIDGDYYAHKDQVIAKLSEVVTLNGDQTVLGYKTFPGALMTNTLTITPPESNSGQGIIITPQSGTSEGGQITLSAPPDDETLPGVNIDQYMGKFRIFGNPSADEQTAVGTGTPLVIDPYGKTITGDYTLTGHATNDVPISSGFGQQLYNYASSNDNTISGTVVRYSSGQATGKPTGTDHALFQMAYNGNWKTQLAQDWRTNKAYIRSCNNGTWGDWAELYKIGDQLSSDLLFANSGTSTRQIRGIVGDNDYWRIAGGATASNAGWMEVATADDGNEPIYARQYTGAYTAIKRTATILDANGDTSFPNRLYVGTEQDTQEQQIVCRSSAGTIYLYSNNGQGNNRGLFCPAHGSGGAIGVLTINTNNQPTYSGYLNRETYQPTTGTAWNIPFCARYNRNEISINDSLRYHFRAGSSQSQTGYAIIQIGNGTDQASANGTRGRIRMFGQGAAFHDIYTNTSANRNIFLPNRGGTIFTTEMFSLSGTTLTISTS